MPRTQRSSGRPRARGRPILYIGCALIVLASTFSLAWAQLHTLRRGYDYQRLKSRRDALYEQNRLLRLEAASLRQLERVEAIARTRLGMVLPARGQVVIVRWKSSSSQGTAP